MKKLYILILFIFYCIILNADNFRISFNNTQKIPWLEDPWSDPRALEIGKEMYMNDFEIMLENVPLDIADDNEDLMYYLEDIYAYNEDISVTIVKRVNVLVSDNHYQHDHLDTVVLIVVGKLKDKYKKED